LPAVERFGPSAARRGPLKGTVFRRQTPSPTQAAAQTS
jgi:hypothetical protein